MESVGTPALFAKLYRSHDGYFVDVVLAEHGQPRRRRLVSPGKEIPLLSSGGFFPLRLGRKAFALCATKIRGLGPGDVERRPMGECFWWDGMYGRHVVD
jgi:hypothetical protein